MGTEYYLYNDERREVLRLGKCVDGIFQNREDSHGREIVGSFVLNAFLRRSMRADGYAGPSQPIHFESEHWDHNEGIQYQDVTKAMADEAYRIHEDYCVARGGYPRG